MHCSVSVSVPIWFTLIRMAFATPSSIPRQPLHVRTEQVIPDKLHPFLQTFCELCPSRPVVLRQAVLNGHDRIAVDPSFIERDHVFGALLAAFALFEGVRAVLVQLGGSHIERD